ncbi:MAG: hypothetical protein HY777_11105 [Betaproteobacteria bacterium]|nr:hypothetical protein [Betaproteobacteria bacterium]
MAHLEPEGILQRYGQHTVVDGVSFAVESCGIACLLDPSDCGKKTLLPCIAGLGEMAGTVGYGVPAYHRPRNRFVTDFVGQGVFLPGAVIDGNPIEVGAGVLELGVPLECGQGCKGCGAEVSPRPDDVAAFKASPRGAPAHGEAIDFRR